MLRNTHNDKCLLIDSSVILEGQKLKDFIQDEYRMYYLDASVLDNNDPEFINFLKYVKENKIPFILTKSHLKLDFCGGEYSQLGSILFEDLPFSNPQLIVANTLFL